MRTMRVFLPFLLFVASLWGANITPVSVQLNWKHQFQFAGLYVALEKGYYADAGLDVTIKEINSSIHPVQDVLDGVSTFGIGYSSLILDRIKGKNIVLLSAFLQHSPLALISLKSSGIHAIKDFKGKKIMIGKDIILSAPILGMLMSNHVRLKDMQVIPPSYDLNDLIDRKVDIVPIYTSNEPFQLKEKHIPYTIWNPKNYGIDVYSDLLYTSGTELKNHPDIVRKFQEATQRGWLYAYDHIPETVELILHKYHPKDKSKLALLYEARVLKGLAFDHSGAFGTVDYQKIEEISYLYHRIETLARMRSFLYQPVNGKTLSLTDQEKAFLAAHPVLTAQSEPYRPPYNFQEHDTPKGLSIDYLDLLASKLGVHARYIPAASLSKKFTLLKQGTLDLILNIQKTKERESFIRFTTPYTEAAETIFTDLPAIHTLDDLGGKKIAIVRGCPMQKYLEMYYPQIQVLLQKNLLDATIAVVEKKADAVIGDYRVIDALMQRNNLSIKHRTIIRDPQLKQHFRIGVSSHNTLLYTLLQKAMSTVTPQEIAALKSKWLGTHGIAWKDQKTLRLSQDEKAYLQKHPTITMCNNPNWRPIEFAEKTEEGNETMQGIAIDTLHELSSILGVRFAHVPTQSWSQSQTFLKEKKCDILPAAIQTEKRKKYALFTPPYLDYKLAVITRDDQKFVRNVHDLEGKVFARKKGSGLISKMRKLLPGISIIETEDYLEAFQKVSSGRADYTIATLPIASYYMSRYGLNNMHIAGYLDMHYRLGIAVRGDKPLLRTILQKGLQQISLQKKKAIFNRWTNIRIEEGFDWHYILYAVLAVLLAGGALYWRHRRLKETLNTTQNMIDSLMEGIIIHDKKGVILDVNKSFLRIFQLDSKDSLIGKNIFDFIAPESQKEAKKSFIKKEKGIVEHRVIRSDGSTAQILTQAAWDLDGDRRLLGVIDITKLREQEAIIDLQSKQAALGEMLENIAHQWRQPLSVITTTASGIKIQKEYNILDDAHLLPAMDTIETQAQYLSQTINDFRNFVKGANKDKAYTLAEAIDTFLHLIEGSIRDNNIHILRDTDQDIAMFGDENKLIQVFINLFNNSRDAFEEHKENGRMLCIMIETEGDHAVIRFRDNAGGIPEEIIDKIFEPYFTTKHKAQGTGLGLHMTHQLIVDGMGGTIHVKNDHRPYHGHECIGALFTITLPRNLQSEPSDTDNTAGEDEATTGSQ